MEKQTFDLQVEMQLEEKHIRFTNNKFSSGDYFIRFVPPITYKYNNMYRIMERLLYEIRTITDKNGTEVQTVSYKVVHPNSSPILLDKVELEGIAVEELKIQLDNFIPSVSCMQD
jgi:hypothetical protein